MNTWTITWMSIRFDSIDDALVTGESSSTGLYNRPRPLGPRPIQRWSNTYAAGGPANHKMWGSRELSAYPDNTNVTPDVIFQFRFTTEEFRLPGVYTAVAGVGDGGAVDPNTGDLVVPPPPPELRPLIAPG